jgi:hypothetical protein
MDVETALKEAMVIDGAIRRRSQCRAQTPPPQQLAGLSRAWAGAGEQQVTFGTPGIRFPRPSPKKATLL